MPLILPDTILVALVFSLSLTMLVFSIVAITIASSWFVRELERLRDYIMYRPLIIVRTVSTQTPPVDSVRYDYIDEIGRSNIQVGG